MKKILIESCSYCPDVNACNHIFLDCPLPDDREDELEQKIRELESSLVCYVSMYIKIKEIVG
jgi:hypothetical protein